ncbi:hypothetical protein D3C87_1772840 [compost metagenome]
MQHIVAHLGIDTVYIFGCIVGKSAVDICCFRVMNIGAQQFEVKALMGVLHIGLTKGNRCGKHTMFYAQAIGHIRVLSDGASIVARYLYLEIAEVSTQGTCYCNTVCGNRLSAATAFTDTKAMLKFRGIEAIHYCQ